MNKEELDAELIKAYESENNGKIARLYGEAGDAATDVNEACFFWTNAYVFALEAGIPEADELRAKLVAEGREA